MPGGGDAAEVRIGAMAVHHATRAAILAAVGMVDAADPTAGAAVAAGAEVAILAAMQVVIQAAIRAAVELIVAAME